ncbi:hypothetical protein J4216_01010 [Candidatus Woesearchaeota archaeon]|nr:hypothetical protein [Candidatus Woesearchaeota archaeon]
MICNICQYEWVSRVNSPKACPRCKRRFDYLSVKIAEIQEAVAIGGQ